MLNLTSTDSETRPHFFESYIEVKVAVRAKQRGTAMTVQKQAARIAAAYTPATS